MNRRVWTLAFVLGISAVVAVSGTLVQGQTTTLAATAQPGSIVGNWVLTAADKLLPDGSRVSDYGNKPHGLVIFTADGYYSLQIYRAERLKFASGDKFSGTVDEYKDASLSMSASFGRYSVDPVKHTITFHRDRSSIPNLDDTTGVDPYELKGDTLSWKVAARKDGSIPITVLRRVSAADPPEATGRMTLEERSKERGIPPDL
jgi:hypothetical protein